MPNGTHTQDLYMVNLTVLVNGTIFFHSTKKFRVYTGGDASTDATEKFRIDNDGNVGIGTTNPLYFTHIRSNMNDVFKLQTIGGGALNFKASDYSIGTCLEYTKWC